MKRLICTLVALGVPVGGAGQAKAQSSYVFTPIDVPESISTGAEGINNSGQIVGTYGDIQFHGHAFLLNGDSYTTLDLPGWDTFAIGVNDAGQIVGGYYWTGMLKGPIYAYLLSDGVYTTIDVPDSKDYTVVGGINASGQIVGSYLGTDFVTHGFLLDNGSYTRLDVPGATSSGAGAINDLGTV